MTVSELEIVKSQLLLLPAEDRLEIGEMLIESVDTDEDIELDEAWEAEIERRVDEIKNGTAQCFSAEEVHAEIRRRIESQ